MRDLSLDELEREWQRVKAEATSWLGATAITEDTTDTKIIFGHENTKAPKKTIYRTIRFKPSGSTGTLKVDQQTDTQLGDSQVAEHLGVMHGINRSTALSRPTICPPTIRSTRYDIGVGPDRRLRTLLPFECNAHLVEFRDS